MLCMNLVFLIAFLFLLSFLLWPFVMCSGWGLSLKKKSFSCDNYNFQAIYPNIHACFRGGESSFCSMDQQSFGQRSRLQPPAAHKPKRREPFRLRPWRHRVVVQRTHTSALHDTAKRLRIWELFPPKFPTKLCTRPKMVSHSSQFRHRSKCKNIFLIKNQKFNWNFCELS